MWLQLREAEAPSVWLPAQGALCLQKPRLFEVLYYSWQSDQTTLRE